MIPIHELLTGNIILYDMFPVVVCGTDVILNTIIVRTAGNEFKTISHEDVNPIGLCEEVLKAIGFSKTGGNETFFTCYETKRRFTVCVANYTDEKHYTKKGDWYVGSDRDIIPSLHWLQNYYFFKYGKLLKEDT